LTVFMIVIELIYNLAILIAVSVLAGFVDNRWPRNTKTGVVTQGFLFGSAAIIAMLNAFTVAPGIIFDGRSVVLSLGTLFFGPISGAIASIMAIGLRVYLGGAGTLTGVSVIAASFLFGVTWYYYRRKYNVEVKAFYLLKFGFVAHLIMIILIMTLPYEYRWDAFRALGFTILIVYPIATVLAGKILKDQEDNVLLFRDLTESEGQYRSLVNEMQHCLSVFKVLYNEKNRPCDYEFFLVNPKYEKLTGLKKEEITGKTIKEIFPNTEEFDNHKFEQVALSGDPAYYESYSVALNRTFQVTVYRPRIHLLAVILDDISERKEFESKLLAAKEQAEAGDRLKTAFMNNISHEIRTPLNGILGFGQLAIQPGLSDADRTAYMNILQTSVDRLISTVTDYMDISLIASGNLKFVNKNIDLHLFLKDLFNQLKVHCRARNLEARLSVPDNYESILLNTDRELLWKALWHILNNALKFTQSGSVTLGYTRIPAYLQFFVEDTGKGINQQFINRIFEPFNQEEITHTRHHEGSGLGLPIAKGIIEKLGGRIWVESKKDSGSKFYIKLPFVQNLQEVENRPYQQEPISENDSPLILIAEDEDSNYLYLEIILKKQKLNVLRAKDGQQAVDLCRKFSNISIVFMDIKMPVMDGLEATHIIKSLRSDLPIIGVTAYALSGDANRLLQAGFDDYLSKPLKREALLFALRKFGIISNPNA